jgi:hypothetical protein
LILGVLEELPQNLSVRFESMHPGSFAETFCFLFQKEHRGGKGKTFGILVSDPALAISFIICSDELVAEPGILGVGYWANNCWCTTIV